MVCDAYLECDHKEDEEVEKHRVDVVGMAFEVKNTCNADQDCQTGGNNSEVKAEQPPGHKDCP